MTLAHAFILKVREYENGFTIDSEETSIGGTKIVDILEMHPSKSVAQNRLYARSEQINKDYFTLTFPDSFTLMFVPRPLLIQRVLECTK